MADWLVSEFVGRTTSHYKNMERRLRKQGAVMGHPAGPHHPTNNRRAGGGYDFAEDPKTHKT